jgi:hypothetical protein
MKCLETRQRHGAKWRRYRKEDGYSTATLEVPISADGLKLLTAAIKHNEHIADLKRRLDLADSLTQQGWKPEAIAHELSLGASNIRRRRAAKKET